MHLSENLPNKCDSCGLRVYLTHHGAGATASIDKQFSDMHLLRRQGIIETVPQRYMTAGSQASTTSYCAVNASAWNNKLTPCRFWSLQIGGTSLADHLTIYHSRRNQEIATLLSVVGVVITIVIAIVQLSK